MKITFLGTGAADWKISEHRDMEGFRRNSSALIDDRLLIDPGPNVFDALDTFGKNASDIKYIINTHRHKDHFREETVAALPGAEYVPFESGETKSVGPYTVIALPANHSAKGTVHFIISDGESRIFYGLDGAWLTYEEVGAIKKEPIDFAVLDATIGDIAGDYRVFEHNSLSMIIEMKKSLEKHVKRFSISHMARTLHGSHDALKESMEKHGIEVAFDGWETEI